MLLESGLFLKCLAPYPTLLKSFFDGQLGMKINDKSKQRFDLSKVIFNAKKLKLIFFNLKMTSERLKRSFFMVNFYLYSSRCTD